MPRYENDPTKVASSIEVFPKDDYEFIVGEPKSFFRINAKGADSYGVRFPVSVAEGPYAGKRTVFTTYQQSEGAQQMAKRFIMAVLGYGAARAEEKRFDADYAGKDWSFDTDTGAVGDMWREASGKRVIGSLDVRMGDDGSEQQDFKGWRVLG